MPSDLEQAIGRTVLWFSIFEIPLTCFEIWKWLLWPRRDYSYQQVSAMLDESVWLSERLISYQGFFVPSDQDPDEFIKKRQTKFLIMALSILFLVMLQLMVFAIDDFQKLVGRWQRTDGGYIIDIRHIDTDGKMEAGYFNPRPIHVKKAKASKDKEHIKIEVELRDIGYPGSTYTLVYVSEKDVLLGYYYHAVSRQHFDVLFVRMN